jgi:hypothetical protein
LSAVAGTLALVTTAFALLVVACGMGVQLLTNKAGSV